MNAYAPLKRSIVKSRWASSKYAMLNVDISSTHTDGDLANIATHTDGSSFSWDEFEAILFITDLQHPENFELKLNDTGNDAILFSARLDSVERVLKVTKIFFTNSVTSATNVKLLLEGY